MKPVHFACALAFVATGCVFQRTVPPPDPAPETAPPVVVPPPPLVPAEPTGLYALDEAVRDVLSGEWQHIGTGTWHGNHRVHVCAYRNDRVVLVNAYCTIKEPRAFRIEIYSPTRGRVRIYAEAKAPVSTVTRRDYFTFNAESEPPPETRRDRVSLGMSFPELQAYEQHRYGQFLPSCHGGVEINRPQGGCLGALAPKAAEWADRNRSFLEQPPEDWYRIVRDLRALAARHGDQEQ